MVGNGQIVGNIDPHYKTDFSQNATYLENALDKRRRQQSTNNRSTAAARASLQKFLADDRPTRYRQEIDAAKNKLVDYGAQLMQAGVTDPFTATDEGSVLFQKEFSRINGMVSDATQIDKYINDSVSKYALKPEDYEESDFNNLVDYGTLSLADAVQQQPPTLVTKRPFGDVNSFLNDTLVKTASAISKDYSPGQALEVVRASVQNSGDKMDDIFRTLKRRYDSMGADGKLALEHEATRNGADIYEQMLANDLMQRKEAFDVAKFQDNVMKDWQAGLDTKVSGSEAGTSTRTIGIDSALNASVKSAMMGDSRAYGYFKELAKQNGVNANSDKEVEQFAIKYFKQFEGGLNTKSEWRPRFESEKGDNEKIGKSFEDWWSALRSPDVTTRANAIRFVDKDKLKGTVPNLPSDAEILDVGMRPDGTMTVSTDEGTYEVDIESRKEALSNAYSETAKNSKRYYGTTETGAKATTAQQQPSNPQTPAFTPGFLNKGK